MNSGFRENLTIIFGAGASCASGAYAPGRDEQCPPPLAKDIFAPIFDDILGHYPQLTRRVREVRIRLAREENVEEILRDLYDSAARHQKYWPFQIPLYLRHLFWTFSLYCESGSTDFDVLVHPVLESSLQRVMFISLNYDLLLDSAIAGCECPKWQFDTMDSYIPKGKKWRLIKPHGSVNWAREISNCPSDRYVGFRPSELSENPRFTTDTEPKVALWSRQHHYPYLPGATTDGYLFPQVVIPADKPKDFACPDSHIQEVRAFLKNCANLLFVGFSGHDDDIISLLETIPRGSRLMIVGMGKQDAQTIFKRMCSRASDIGRKELVATFYNAGFSEFIRSGELERYLTHANLSDKGLLRMDKVSTREAARRLGLSFPTLNRYIAAGKVPVPRVQEAGTVKFRLWSEEDIEKVRKRLPKIANGRKTRYKKKAGKTGRKK